MTTLFVPVAWEELPWTSQINPDLMSNRQRRLIPATYRAAIPTTLASVTFPIDGELAAEAEDAATAIVRLDAQITALFGDADIAPMQSVLLRTESAASSQIEHLTVGARQLAVAELGGAASGNAQMIVGNVAAMRAAIGLAGSLNKDTILAMHEALLASSRPNDAGVWRSVPVWIGASGSSPRNATFVPPQAVRIPNLVDDLVTFLNRTDLPVLISAAIGHAQFETIHPFVDGNGRIGRALLHAQLRHCGLTSRITVPISAGLLSQTGNYFQALTDYRAGNVQSVIRCFCQAAHNAVALGQWLTTELSSIRRGWMGKINARAGSAAHALLDVLIGKPAVNVATVCDYLGISETATRRAIAQLETAGVLKESTDKRRNRVWLAPDVLAVMDDFAQRAGRRTTYP